MWFSQEYQCEDLERLGDRCPNDGRVRAQWSWTLLDGFTQIPGLVGDRLEIKILEAWIGEVRRLAAEVDRVVIADQKIGGLLAHAPEDSEDHEWPHRVI